MRKLLPPSKIVPGGKVKNCLELAAEVIFHPEILAGPLPKLLISIYSSA